jgi:hypothetical protein
MNEPKRYGPHEAQRDREGNVLDPKGWKMTERACPRCHLQMPQDLLARRPVFVSVVGAPRSGKTYFVTSMIHGLRHELPRYFGYTFDDADSHDITAFLEHERALFHPDDPTKPTFLQKTQEYGHLYHVVHLDGADVQLPRPFIFALRPTEMNIDRARHGSNLNCDIVVYDNAGESFNYLVDRNQTNRVTQHLAESDVVLFTFDPLQDGNARSRLASLSSDPQLTVKAFSSRQESTLGEVASRIRRHAGIPQDRRIPSVLGICVQKFDVWRDLLPHRTVQMPDGTRQDLLDHTSIEWDAVHGVGRFDIPEINNISLLVRSFIEDLCPQLVAFAEANFRIVRYFPVSALGTSPQLDASAMSTDAADMLKVQPQAIQPFRVTHPILWVLQRQRLIRRVHGPNGSVGNIPSGTIQQVGSDRFRLVAPVSGRVFVLDHDYQGCTVIDPYCGQWMSIPKLPESATSNAASATAKAPVSANAQATPQVQPPVLTIEQPKPRRGWFKG